MKIFEVDFEGMYPVGNCLIIAARSQEEAEAMAKKEILHPQEEPIVVREVNIKKPKVIVYLSGDY
jgi:hypothetical protein